MYEITKSALKYFSLLVLLTGCTTAMNINGERVKVRSDQIAVARQSWDSGAASTAEAASQAGPVDREFILDFIATYERDGGGGVPPCSSLTLGEIFKVPPRTVSVSAPNGDVVIRPRKYFELWSVSACGATHVYHVIDDISNQGRVTVFLRKDQSSPLLKDGKLVLPKGWTARGA